ncbi:PDDEXK nuclease domain-containing protein [uncultured Methanolobus sp.]|uniref:PDDEXK nuclease domain-containing protein n=1 Tax=uncultured Methanolobus sp. TaxID=218300 RepID=UPI002AAAB48E|nr:PDDEXK nuclease domain-containing protein [uncultured Methanolobus sp.]
MSLDNDYGFKQLVDLCTQTHQEMQRRAGRSVDIHLVIRNWLFGWYIVEYEQNGSDRAEYGAGLVKQLSGELGEQLGRGFSARTLEQCRKFYLMQRKISQTMSAQFGIDKTELPLEGNLAIPQTVSAISEASLLKADVWQNVVTELLGRFTLGWSHYVTLMTVENADERRFYEIEATQNYWSVRELERQISSSLYERLALSRNKEEIRRLAEEGLVVEKAADLIKNPLVLEFLGLEEKPCWSENELESAIIDRLETFLLELGKGFLFEGRQKRFTFDNDHFYIDLVFYNRLLRCYVLIDLKRDKLTHQDLGQMQMYVNYFDRHVKTDDELPTIGIVLCRRKNDALVELTLPEKANIFAPKYQLYLPSKAELKAQLEKIEDELEASTHEF